MARPHFALLTTDLSAVEKDDPSMDEIAEVYPTLTIGSVVREDSLAEWPRLVVVRPEPPPPLGYGDVPIALPPVKKPDGSWYETWQIVPPNLTALKTDARRQVNDLEDRKISIRELARGLRQIPAAPRPRTEAVMVEADRIRGLIDAAVDAAGVKSALDQLEAF